MVDGIGKALASAIKEPAAAGPEKRGRHIFLNLHRRRIFTALTVTPCIGVTALAAECGISQSTAEWHLETLVRSGYAVMYGHGRQRLFYPEGLITAADADFFAALNHRKTGGIFRIILANPGITLTGIAEALGLSRKGIQKPIFGLEKEGLVSRMTDGANARFYPTGLLGDRAESFYPHSKEFSDFIVRKLESEGGKPPAIIKKDIERVIVETGHAAERFTLEIGINPYITCLVC